MPTNRIIWSVIFAVLIVINTSASASGQPEVVSTCKPNAYIREQQAPGMPVYWLRNPHWLNQQYPGCVRTNMRTAFTVTATPPASYDVTMFPDEMVGCEWGICTPNSQFPIQVKDINRLYSRWVQKRTPHVWGTYDRGYDLWLTNRRYTTGRHNGVELMIWLGQHGRCCWTAGSRGVVHVGRWRYLLMTRWMHDKVHNATWRFIEYRMLRQRWEVRRFDLARFLHRAVLLGLVHPDQWVESVAAGYEVWFGARGLQTKQFAVRLN